MINLEEIGKLLEKEISEPELSSIPNDTYTEVASIVKNLKRVHINNDINSQLKSSRVNLLSKMAVSLLQLRLQKITNHNGDYSNIVFNNLTSEEKYFMNFVNELEKRKSNLILSIEEGRSSVLESISSQILSKNILLSFLKPTNSFVGTDLNNYGPFKIEDVGLIPFQNAILLIKQGIAKEIYTPI